MNEMNKHEKLINGLLILWRKFCNAEHIISLSLGKDEKAIRASEALAHGVVRLRSRILKAMERPEVVITEQQRSFGNSFFVCICSGEEEIHEQDNYCPKCGRKVTWRLNNERNE